jgi:hypothetical protein
MQKERVQIYLYTMWFLYMFIFICGHSFVGLREMKWACVSLNIVELNLNLQI